MNDVSMSTPVSTPLRARSRSVSRSAPLTPRSLSTPSPHTPRTPRPTPDREKSNDSAVIISYFVGLISLCVALNLIFTSLLAGETSAPVPSTTSPTQWSLSPTAKAALNDAGPIVLFKNVETGTCGSVVELFLHLTNVSHEVRETVPLRGDDQASVVQMFGTNVSESSALRILNEINFFSDVTSIASGISETDAFARRFTNEATLAASEESVRLLQQASRVAIVSSTIKGDLDDTISSFLDYNDNELTATCNNTTTIAELEAPLGAADVAVYHVVAARARLAKSSDAWRWSPRSGFEVENCTAETAELANGYCGAVPQTAVAIASAVDKVVKLLPSPVCQAP